MRAGAPMVSSALQAGDSGSAGDYHEYTLGNPVDLASGTLLRAALFPAQTIACQRQYVFEGSRLRANPGMALDRRQVRIARRASSPMAPVDCRSSARPALIWQRTPDSIRKCLRRAK